MSGLVSHHDSGGVRSQAIVQWLQLPALDQATSQRVQAKTANRGHNHRSAVPGCDGERTAMLPETQQLLRKFYAPLINMLAAQIGDHFRWDDAGPRVQT